MGYRIYLGEMSNERYEKIKDVESYEELKSILELNDSEYVGVYDISESCLHEFGKYIDWTDNVNSCEEVFLNKDFNSLVCEEGDFFIIDKKGLEFIIDEYNEEMRKYFQNQYCLSNILMFLTDTKKEDNNKKKRYKEIHKECFDIIKNDDFMNLKFDLDEFLCLNFEDFYDKDKKDIINKIIVDIVAKQYMYFEGQYFDYKGNRKHYDLTENKLKLTNSWKKDLNILELVNIYKDFDWNNRKMLIYGY